MSCSFKLGESMPNTDTKDYVTVKIPREIANEIDHIIQVGILGYRSRAELAVDAIRRRLEQLNSTNSTT